MIQTKYRTIKTEIPVPESAALIQEMQKYEADGAHNQMPVVWDRAEDFQVYDKWGNKYIDFTSTIFVANIGHSNPEVVSAIHQQLDKHLIHSYNFPTDIRVKFLKELLAFLPPYLEKVALFSAGTETIERAMEIARTRRPKIVSFEQCFHGRTMGALSLKNGGQDIIILPFPYPWTKNNFYKDIKKVNPKKVGAIIIESYQGWGGIFYPKEYWILIKTIFKLGYKVIFKNEP